MRQIAKWTILCVLCAAFGFGATILVANSERVVHTLAAMLPAPAEAAPAPVVEPAELAAVDESAVDAPAVVPLASEAAAADDFAFTTLATGSSPAAAQPQQAVPGALSAVGTVSVVRDRQVVLGASGRVEEINVEVGDTVSAGDVLVALDTTYLEWAVEQAEIRFETARIEFEEAGKAIKDSDIAVAEANLLLAQENLAEVSAGPAEEEMAAAESRAAAEWAAYEELQEQPTRAQLVQAQAQLKKAQLAVEAAQREYDKIAWLPEAAATEAASDLQIATVEYEAAQAEFEEASKPATQARLQSALASAQSAQADLNELRKRPTPAELADAKAELADAEARLAELLDEENTAPVRIAELDVRDAMIGLEEARLALENATVTAPIDGTVLAVDVELGEQVSDGSVVVVLANTNDIQLKVNVEQRDIARIGPGQPVEIAIYALPADTFYGVVERIAPTADASSSFVTFPVVVRFTDGPLEKVLPGMTASAIFLNDDGEPLRPSSALPEPADEPSPTATPTATSEPTATAEATATPLPTEEAAEAEPTADAAEGDEAIATATPLPESEPTSTPSN